MALVWTDYNKYKKEISINKTMDISNRSIYPRPKTDSSEDIVPLPKFINEMLSERYQREKQMNKYFDEQHYFIFGGLALNIIAIFIKNLTRLLLIIIYMR
ncbi:hypothetical protein [Staphylococcus coagulans]|nr:hypothetical protein [Staphylococcus coagulans]